MKPLVLFSLLMFFGITSNAQVKKMSFVDESASDAGFNRFLTHLKSDLQNKDCSELLSKLDSTIILDYGGGYGKKLFVEIWKPCDSNSLVYRNMIKALNLGGRFSEDKLSFTAPYIYTDFPYIDDDKFHVVTIDSVVLYKDSLLSVPLEKMNAFEILNVVEQNETRVKVMVANEIRFVQADKVFSPYDYHLVFRKVKGVWKIVEFLAGV